MWARRKIAAADQSGFPAVLVSAPATPAPHAASVLPLTTSVLATSDIAESSLSADAEDGENVVPLGSALDPSMELDWAALLGAAGRAPAKPDGVSRVLCACGRVSDVGRKCLCCRVPTAQTPEHEVPPVQAAPSWRWVCM